MAIVTVIFTGNLGPLIEIVSTDPIKQSALLVLSAMFLAGLVVTWKLTNKPSRSRRRRSRNIRRK